MRLLSKFTIKKRYVRVLLSDEFSPKIVFGKSDHIIDVPEIAVDKLVVNAEHTYTFPWMRRTENLSVTKRVLFMEKWRTRYG